VSDRYPCACRQCPCPSSAYAYGDPCPSCRDGFHRPPEQVQRHLREGLEAWHAFMPVTLGSSGLSPKQLGQAADAWDEWHGQRPCPVAP